MGRFLQADTVVPGAGNPQALNRYSYVLNGPLTRNDPSGHEPCETGSSLVCDEAGSRERSRSTPRPPEELLWWWEHEDDEWAPASQPAPVAPYGPVVVAPAPMRATQPAQATAGATATATATVAASPAPRVFYYGTTIENAENMRRKMDNGSFSLDPSKAVWNSGEFGVGLYTTASLNEAVLWAYDARRRRGGEAVVVALMISGFEQMSGRYVDPLDAEANAVFGVYDAGYDYLWGPVVASAHRGTQYKFNVQAFPEVRFAGIVWIGQP